MPNSIKTEISQSVQDFSLPRYHQIPDVGLYLEQTAKYITEYLSCLGQFSLTGSMISNYVKKKLIPSPEKKLYCREQIAELFFIAVVKTVTTIEDLELMLRLQRSTYSTQVAYDYFCLELQNVLLYTLGAKDTLDALGSRHTSEKELLRNAIIAVAHKVYLEKYCQALRKGDSSTS